MLQEQTAFIRAIAENPFDDGPRLAFADWLEAHNDPTRAEFIRLQCELEPIREQREIPRAAELHDREDTLLWKHREEWCGTMPDGWDHWKTAASIEFHRGYNDPKNSDNGLRWWDVSRAPWEEA